MIARRMSPEAYRIQALRKGTFDHTYSWGHTNPEVLASILRIHSPARVLDVTWGKGNFWRNETEHWRPLVTGHDISIDGVDLRDLPYEDATWPCVVLDPPYRKAQWSSTKAVLVNHNYGLADLPDGDHAYAHIDALYQEGITEAARVLQRRGILIVKCQDQRVSLGRRWTHRDVMGWMEDNGLEVVDIAVVAIKSVPPPHITKHGLRNAHSYFVVGRKP